MGWIPFKLLSQAQFRPNAHAEGEKKQPGFVIWEVTSRESACMFGQVRRTLLTHLCAIGKKGDENSVTVLSGKKQENRMRNRTSFLRELCEYALLSLRAFVCVFTRVCDRV